MDAIELMPVLESLIFVSENPVRIETIIEIIPESSREAILEAIQKIRQACDEEGRGVELVEVAGGYQFRTKTRWAEWINRLKKAKPFKLSQSALETLAIIAYRQPVIRPEIEQVRGVDSGWVVRSLLERGLIKMMGRRDIPGRPIVYGTTKAFLELFGLNVLSDLPTLKEVQPPSDLGEIEKIGAKRASVKKEITSSEESEISEVLEEIEKDKSAEGEVEPHGHHDGVRYREALEELQKSQPEEESPDQEEPGHGHSG
ncbi:MAG: SMC-Scp complex subunit ScpB [Deltaproteobacteria bacterium]|nr:MAG: SMC-Scp complex subunit ScpB [Deltaproteobacteria bacterium]